jgi:hypothetical protein
LYPAYERERFQQRFGRQNFRALVICPANRQEAIIQALRDQRPPPDMFRVAPVSLATPRNITTAIWRTTDATNPVTMFDQTSTQSHASVGNRVTVRPQRQGAVP